MKRIISTMAAVLLLVALISGYGAKSAAVGTWQDKNQTITLDLKSDGTGTLSVYVEMLKSNSENKLVYTCEGNTIQWKLADGDSDGAGSGSGGYSTLQIEDDTIDVEGVTLYRK